MATRRKRRTKAEIASKPVAPQPDHGMLGIVLSVVLVVLPYVLQANGVVDLSWQLSMLAYAVCGVVGSWSIYKHGIPHWGTRLTRFLVIFVIIIACGALGFYGTRKQYLKEHKDQEVKSETVHDFFKNDFKQLAFEGTLDAVYADNGKTNTASNIEYRVLHDIDSKTRFVCVYVPRLEYPFETVAGLSTTIKDILSWPADRVTLPPARGNNGTQMKLDNRPIVGVVATIRDAGDISSVEVNNLPFSGSIYLYHEDPLTIQQLGQLDQIYRSKSLSPQFRSWPYAGAQALKMRTEPK